MRRVVRWGKGGNGGRTCAPVRLVTSAVCAQDREPAGSPIANAFAIAAEDALHGVGAPSWLNAMCTRPNRLLLRSTRRAGDAGNSQAQRSTGAAANSFGHGLGNLRGDGAVRGNQFGRHARELGFQFVGVDDSAAEKRTRRPGTEVMRCAIMPPVQLSATARVAWRRPR